MAISNAKIYVTLASEWGQVKTKALLDSGNNSDIVISEKLHNKLNASFVKLGGNVLGAGRQRLKVKGVSTPMKLKFKEKTYIVRPTVIRDLTDNVNIGRNFMKKLEIGLKFGHPDVMESNEGEIPMIKSMKEGRGRDPKKGPGAKEREKQTIPQPVMASETILVPPNCLYFVKCNTIEGERVVEPLRDPNMQALPAVYRDAEKVAVLNLASEFRIVKAGEGIGDAYECRVDTVKAIEEIEENCDTEAKERDEKEQLRTLLKDLGIAENELLKNNPGIRQRPIEILEKHKEVFSSPEKNIGRTNLVEFTVRTIPGAQPVKEPGG